MVRCNNLYSTGKKNEVKYFLCAAQIIFRFLFGNALNSLLTCFSLLSCILCLPLAPTRDDEISRLHGRDLLLNQNTNQRSDNLAKTNFQYEKRQKELEKKRKKEEKLKRKSDQGSQPAESPDQPAQGDAPPPEPE